MTHEELLAGLSPARLPPHMASLSGREYLAVIGFGLLAGLLIGLLVRPFLARKPSRRALIQATRGQPAQERILAISRILGHLPEALRPAAYGSGPSPDEAMIEHLALARKPRG